MGFKDAFRKKNPKLLNVGSEAWQNYINSQAPQGTHYQFDGKSDYFLTPNDDTSLDFKLKIRIPEDLKQIQIHDANDLTELLYRAQRTVEVEVPEVSYGDKQITIDQIRMSFKSEIKSEEGKFFISPAPFRAPFDIPIKINDKTYHFKIKQVPFPSLKEMRFESSEDGMIFIKIEYNEETSQMNFSLTYNLQKANNVSEIYDKKNFFNDLCNGNIKIFDKETKVLTEDQSNDLKHLLTFYSKLYEIEQKLKIQFDPKERIQTEDILNTNKLYISLVKDGYYYEDQKHKSIEITFKEEIDLTSYENAPMLGYNEVTINILNQNIHMFEQFMFKKTNISNQKKKIKVKGELLEISVLDDRIQYNKLFDKIPEKLNLDEILEKLDHAKNIESSMNEIIDL